MGFQRTKTRSQSNRRVVLERDVLRLLTEMPPQLRADVLRGVRLAVASVTHDMSPLGTKTKLKATSPLGACTYWVTLPRLRVFLTCGSEIRIRRLHLTDFAMMRCES